MGAISGSEVMSIKVALALNADGTLLEHFGHAERFAVYELGANIPVPVQREIRQASAFCQREEKQSKLESVADLLADCRAVVCAAIGPCARQELSYANVEAFESAGGIEDAVRAISRQSFLARLERNTLPVTTVSKESYK
jgi:predicted Fe-Mo cluster-binding NifX family protein